MEPEGSQRPKVPKEGGKVPKKEEEGERASQMGLEQATEGQAQRPKAGQ
jgi:hypothetical protein